MSDEFLFIMLFSIACAFKTAYIGAVFSWKTIPLQTSAVFSLHGCCFVAPFLFTMMNTVVSSPASGHASSCALPFSTRLYVVLVLCAFTFSLAACDTTRQPLPVAPVDHTASSPLPHSRAEILTLLTRQSWVICNTIDSSQLFVSTQEAMKALLNDMEVRFAADGQLMYSIQPAIPDENNNAKPHQYEIGTWKLLDDHRTIHASSAEDEPDGNNVFTIVELNEHVLRFRMSMLPFMKEEVELRCVPLGF